MIWQAGPPVITGSWERDVIVALVAILSGALGVIAKTVHGRAAEKAERTEPASPVPCAAPEWVRHCDQIGQVRDVLMDTARRQTEVQVPLLRDIVARLDQLPTRADLAQLMAGVTALATALGEAAKRSGRDGTTRS